MSPALTPLSSSVLPCNNSLEEEETRGRRKRQEEHLKFPVTTTTTTATAAADVAVVAKVYVVPRRAPSVLLEERGAVS